MTDNSIHANTVPSLDEMLRRAYVGNMQKAGELSKSIHAESSKNLRWERVRHLRIIGDGYDIPLGVFQCVNLPRGFYLNDDGSWLLVILSKKPDLQGYIDRCAQYLQSLWIMNTEMYSKDLSILPNLKALRLEDNRLLNSITHLETLTDLEELSIRDCPRVTELPGLENLTSLTELDLYGCINLMILPPLDRLEHLRVLNLSLCNKLSKISGLDKLSQLSKMELHGCSSITELPSLSALTNLIELKLSDCKRLAVLSGVENLTKLTSLSLYGCSSLDALPDLHNLSNLSELDLSNCTWLHDVPESIRHLKNLRFLNLSMLDLIDLPDWLTEIAAEITANHVIGTHPQKAAVWLYETTVETIPDMSIFQQPYDMVLKWFEERRLGKTRPLDEIKVVFLGDGEAGKSYTIARMMNDGGGPVGYVDVRTPGIVIKDICYPVGGRRATLHLWDFGGQDILHSMHRIFLTERTIYVVLVDGSIGNQDERARYWLQNIQGFAKDAPVVLVLNKLDDGLQAEVNAVDLREKYKVLKQIVKLSARQYSRERFNLEFRDVLLEEIRKTGFLDAQWPDSWIQVKNALQNMDVNYIHGGEYLRICRELNVEENQKPLLRWFHDLGISFCYCDDDHEALEDYVVLKPNWITNALYIILFNEREGGKGGVVPIRTIRNMLGWDAPNRDTIKRVIPDAYYVGYDVNYVLDVFHAFKLSFPKDDRHEFFPMLADVNAKPVASEYAQNMDNLEFYMTFDYLPNNLLHRLMVERHQELDMDNVWLTGARFSIDELGLSAVVVIDDKTLRFYIRRTTSEHRPNTYLTMLKANVDRIVERMGLKPPSSHLVYKIDGGRDEFDYEVLRAMQEAGQSHTFSMTWRRMLPIADILNQSAPDGLEDERKLLDAIHRSCRNIQGEPDYRLNGNDRDKEDKRNRRIRDDLHGWGYSIQDQSQRGISESGKGIGELDLLLYDEKRAPWTVIEALRVSDGTKAPWNRHLTKMLGNYNFFGARFLYLLTYVDAGPADFSRIWEGYLDDIPTYQPKGFEPRPESFADLTDPNGPQYVRTARMHYRAGSDSVTVYHIFARIPPQNE